MSTQTRTAGKRALVVALTALLAVGGLVAAPVAANAVDFTNAPRPKVTGTLKVGQTVTATGADASAWTPAATTVTYQWLRGNNNEVIPGATSSTYTLTADDLGKRISVEAYAVRSPGGYAQTMKSGYVATLVTDVLKQTPTPKITGKAEAGQTLTAVTGSWDTGATVSLQWQKDGSAISGATSSTYKLKAADRGAKISVAATGTKQYHDPATRISSQTGAVSAAPAPAPTKPATSKPTQSNSGSSSTVAKSKSHKITVKKCKPARKCTKITKPKVKGSTAVGKKVVASLKKRSHTKLRYQWYRDGKKIAGATHKSYKVKASDYGHKIRVKVSAKKAGKKKTIKISAPKKVRLGTLIVKTPKITGTAKAGHRLTASHKWPGTVKYQWLVSGKSISGANGKSYTATTADRGKKVSVRVTTTKHGYKKKTRTTAAIKIARPASTSNPTPVGNVTTKQIEDRIFELTNKERTKAGLPTFVRATEMKAGADAWLKPFAAASGDWEHSSFSYWDSIDSLCRTNGEEPGENLGAAVSERGLASADSLVSRWMKSPGHRAQILNELGWENTRMEVSVFLTGDGEAYCASQTFC